MLYLSKNKLHWNQKTKNQFYIKCWKCPPHSAMHALFSSCLMQPGEEFFVREAFHQTRYCRFVGKCIPKLILAS
jgi:hypothetical protein